MNEVRAWGIEEWYWNGKTEVSEKNLSYCVLLTGKKTSAEHVNKNSINIFIIISLIRLFVTLLKVI